MSRRVTSRVFGCLAIFLIITAFAISVEAAEVKTSQLNGGVQYWWQAEDFEDRDADTFVLGSEPGGGVPDLPGALGNDYLVHDSDNQTTAVEGEKFAKYTVIIDAGGTYYLWTRASWDRTPGGRSHNSNYVQVNGQPAIGAFERHVNSFGDATFPDVFDENNPWMWIGDSRQPEALQGQPGGGLANGLAMEFTAGENTVVLYHREGGVGNPQTMCTDAFMMSTVDFVPTDADYEQATAPTTAAVESMGKLTITWAQLKRAD